MVQLIKVKILVNRAICDCNGRVEVRQTWVVADQDAGAGPLPDLEVLYQSHGWEGGLPPLPSSPQSPGFGELLFEHLTGCFARHAEVHQNLLVFRRYLGVAVEYFLVFTATRKLPHR